MNLPEMFQKLCDAGHPLGRGVVLEEHLRNGGGHDMAATISTVLAKWERERFREDEGRASIDQRLVTGAFPLAISRLEHILISTSHGLSERSAAIAKAVEDLPTKTERSVLLSLLLARRSGPLAECLYVTTGSPGQPPEAFETPGLMRLLLK